MKSQPLQTKDMQWLANIVLGYIYQKKKVGGVSKNGK